MALAHARNHKGYARISCVDRRGKEGRSATEAWDAAAGGGAPSFRRICGRRCEMDGHGGRAGRLCRTMRTMVLSTWWALMKRRIGDAMSAGVRERSRASEWVLEREPSAFSLGCLSTCNGCDVYSKSVRSVSTSRCIYLLPSVRMSKSVLNSIPKIENRPSVVRSSLSRRNRLHWRPRARDPTRARQRTRVDPRGRASRPRSESAHTRATGTRARTHADRLPPSPARARVDPTQREH